MGYPSNYEYMCYAQQVEVVGPQKQGIGLECVFFEPLRSWQLKRAEE